MHQTSPHLVTVQVETPRAVPLAPQWTDYVSTFAVPFIAAIAAWIAYRQFKIAAKQSEISLKQTEIALQQAETARKKLKLDLFEKRMTVYETVRRTLGAAARSGKLTHEEEIEYLVGTRSAHWLFGPEVFKYLDETLWHKIVDLGTHNAMSDGPAGEERTKHIYAAADTLKWLMAQYKEFDKMCEEYLALGH